jgi:hypothetical protein
MAEIAAVDEPAQAGALMSIMKARGPGGKEPESPATVKAKEDCMSKTAEELQAELTKSADELAKANARAERAEKLGELTDAERSHYKSLKGKAQDEFLAKSADERKAIVDEAIAKSREADPVIYKSKVTGAEYRKSDDPRLIDMAKRDDEREEDLRKMREEAANAVFEKRASTEFAKFKGDLTAKTTLVKAVAGIKDDALRAGVEEMLKAAHGAVQLTLKEVGSKKDDFTADDMNDDTKKSAEAKLDQLAKARSAEKNEPYIKAYQAVLNSDEGKALYAKSVGAA